MKSILRGILIVLCITLLGSTQLFGQEWSEEQKEVWAAIEKGWELGAKGDMEGMRPLMHDDCSIWNQMAPLPWDNETGDKFWSYNLNQKKLKVLIYYIKPAEINIFDNVAIVHYFWFQTTKIKDEKEKNDSGRTTSILMKEEDNWLFIGEFWYWPSTD